MKDSAYYAVRALSSKFLALICSFSLLLIELFTLDDMTVADSCCVQMRPRANMITPLREDYELDFISFKFYNLVKGLPIFYNIFREEFDKFNEY